VIKRMRYPLDVMLTCVRWHVVYPLSLRHIEGRMAEQIRAIADRNRDAHPCGASRRPRSIGYAGAA
jgi:hypothetical protein